MILKIHTLFFAVLLAVCQFLPYQHVLNSPISVVEVESENTAQNTVSEVDGSCCATACEAPSEANQHKSCCCYPSESSHSETIADKQNGAAAEALDFVIATPNSCSPTDQLTQSSILVFSSQRPALETDLVFNTVSFSDFLIDKCHNSFTPHKNTAKVIPHYIEFESFLC